MNDKIQMYFDPVIAEDFAEHEQNEKNYKVANIVDQVIMKVIWCLNWNFKACELWGWAHPDRYHNFFNALLENNWSIDWVDISPYMLNLAKKYINTRDYLNRFKVINFIEKDIITYLNWIEDESLDLWIMKYTIDHIGNIDELFWLLKRKLKKWWVLIASIWILSEQLKSISTNARFLYNWEEFPKDETRILKDGDTFTVKFFNVSWNPEEWYIPWGETTKFYHSEEKYKTIAKVYWFKLLIWNWKEIIWDNKQEIDQDIMILTNN